MHHTGAKQVMVVSKPRMALLREFGNGHEEQTLEAALPYLDSQDIDLVSIEGFNHAPCPKIALYRPSRGKQLICKNDSYIEALASDADVAEVPAGLLELDINTPEAVVEFIHKILWTFREISDSHRSADFDLIGYTDQCHIKESQAPDLVLHFLNRRILEYTKFIANGIE